MKWAFVLTLAVGSSMTGCFTDDGEDLGHYYEFAFTDDMRAVIAGDSIHVLVLQIATTPQYLQAIPVQLTDKVSLLDTVEFRMNVLYGGYSPTPTPNRLVQPFQDSIIVKYDRAAGFSKSGSPTGGAGVQTSPRITYYSIQSVEILKAPNRHIAFESRLMH